MGIKINGKQFLFIVLIVSLLFISNYESRIASALSQFPTQAELNPGANKEWILEIDELTALSDAKAGIKQAEAKVDGASCEIVEPVYASIKCFKSYGLYQETLYSGDLVRDNGYYQGVEIWENGTEWTNYDIFKDFPTDKIGVWTKGNVQKIRWDVLLKSLPKINEVIVDPPNQDIIFIGEYVDGTMAILNEVDIWDGDVLDPKSTKFSSTLLKNVYLGKIGSTWNLWPCTLGCKQLVDPGKWSLTFRGDDEHLEFEVPGSIPSHTFPSDRCNLLEEAEIQSMMASVLDGNLPLQVQLAQKDEIDKLTRDYQNNVGDILDSKGSREYVPDAAVGTNEKVADYFDLINPKSGILGSGALDCPGCAILYPYLYRNTNVILDSGVYPGRYNGETVLCDQKNERLIKFTKIPQTQAMSTANKCYVMPTQAIDMSDVDRFSCSQSVCTGEFARLGYGLWDAENFQCVPGDTVITGGKLCQEGGVGYCGDYVPLPLEGGGCLEVGEKCVANADAKAQGFYGYCEIVENELPLCCPGERTPSGLVCNSDGTAYIQSVISKDPCPPGACCYGNPLYEDTFLEENNGCRAGTVCCLDTEKGETIDSCTATQCEQGSVTPPNLVDDIINRLKEELGLDQLGENVSKVLTWILIGIVVIVGLVLLFFVFNFLFKLLAMGSTLNRMRPQRVPRQIMTNAAQSAYEAGVPFIPPQAGASQTPIYIDLGIDDLFRGSGR